MGSEIVIPGTPLDQIPTYDRPVFDASKQNGYLGGLANPTPGTSVQRFSLSLQSKFSALPANIAIFKVGNVVIPAGGTSASLASIAGTSSIESYMDALVNNEQANTTAAVSIVDVAGAQAPIPASSILTLRGVDVNAITLLNNDTVARTLRVYLTPTPPAEICLYDQIDLAAVLGLSVTPRDVLRLRHLTIVALQGVGEQTMMLSQRAMARITLRQSAAGAMDLNPGWSIPLLGPGDGQRASSATTDAGVIFATSGSTDILGTDWNNGATNLTPKLDLKIFGVGSSVGPQVQYNVYALFDLYIGANQ